MGKVLPSIAIGQLKRQNPQGGQAAFILTTEGTEILSADYADSENIYHEVIEGIEAI